MLLCQIQSNGLIVRPDLKRWRVKRELAGKATVAGMIYLSVYFTEPERGIACSLTIHSLTLLLKKFVCFQVRNGCCGSGACELGINVGMI